MAADPGRIFRWRHLWFTLAPAVLLHLAGNQFGLLPAGLVAVRQVAPAADLPDLRLLPYDGAAAYAMISALGEEGRARYRDMLLVVDLAYPLLYGAGLAVAIGCLWRGAWRLLVLLPLLAAAADLGENACALALLAAFPGRMPVAEALAGPCTAAKWILVASAQMALAGGALAAWRRRQSAGTPAARHQAR